MPLGEAHICGSAIIPIATFIIHVAIKWPPPNQTILWHIKWDSRAVRRCDYSIIITGILYRDTLSCLSIIPQITIPR